MLLVSRVEEMLELNKHVNHSYPNSQEMDANHESVRSISSLSSGLRNHVTNVTLPTISFPTFDGTFTYWREFRDKFVCLIDQNESLSKIQKFTYLKSSLKGEPSDLLTALETTDKNYDIAWSRLEKRYNNKRRIVNNHVQALLNLPKGTRESHQALRNMITTTQNHLDCLKTLDIPVNEWDALLIPILLEKLDSHTSKEWETKISKTNASVDKLPTLDEFIEFLNMKQNILELTQTRTANEPQRHSYTQKSTREIRTYAALTATCTHCKRDHSLHACEAFLKLGVLERYHRVREMQVCLNCLSKGHMAQNCQSTRSCRTCRKRHHSLLHMTYEQLKNIGNKSTARIDKPQENAAIVGSVPNRDNTLIYSGQISLHCSVPTSEIFLSTAQIIAYDELENAHTIRVLLDSASQSNFVTKDLCTKLNLKLDRAQVNIKGINDSKSKVTEVALLKIKSRLNNFTTTIKSLVLPEITNHLPIQSVQLESIKIPKHIKLADPTFNVSGPIDMLIGANLFYTLLCTGQIKETQSPCWQKTKFGWVASGGCIEANQIESVSCLSLEELHKNVESFWNADEFIESKRMLTPDEQYCETLFKTTTMRNINGQFVVRLPLKNSVDKLGDSKPVALSRLLLLEQRFRRDPMLKEMYTAFMQEYLQLNHMTESKQIEGPSFYLPHHAVINNASETTKLRVVFDGSCKLEHGLSINDVQYVGPTIQDDLTLIIARFRLHRYVTTADVTKMYRQVVVHPSDRKYQKILWRTHEDEEVREYELNTVTYGTTAAPFLAIRSLKQVGKEHKGQFPKESNIIDRDFYVDDVITGSDTIENLTQIKSNLKRILDSAGFSLRKWTSNVHSLSEKNESNQIPITEKIHKTLRIYWNPHVDQLLYRTQLKPQDTTTKRIILATISQLFDPLGLLAPIMIYAKLIIQDLWKSQIGWDESLPFQLQTRWVTFKDQIKHINRIQIPRCVLIEHAKTIETHTFADASEKGYGACMFIKSRSTNNQVKINLLAAKSRVCPVKPVTIPRLELCAAVLAAKLVDKFRQNLNIKIDREYFWTDSKIVLC